ncbi:hypothetical protein PVAP13_9KG228926 [Panicum virgatum]|uniref:Uncharacterized protein n=1 Tax=Panicum virgatum TaxID=38727 RepID=A0A8T0NQD9_PANVG|nr:hypothetical protein PVAP13_9KG228926 [Panicum virgatum]
MQDPARCQPRGCSASSPPRRRLSLKSEVRLPISSDCHHLGKFLDIDSWSTTWVGILTMEPEITSSGLLLHSFLWTRKHDMLTDGQSCNKFVTCKMNPLLQSCGRTYLQAQHFHLQDTVYCYSLQILACRVCHHEILASSILLKRTCNEVSDFFLILLCVVRHSDLKITFRYLNLLL